MLLANLEKRLRYARRFEPCGAKVGNVLLAAVLVSFLGLEARERVAFVNNVAAADLMARVDVLADAVLLLLLLLLLMLLIQMMIRGTKSTSQRDVQPWIAAAKVGIVKSIEGRAVTIAGEEGL